MSILREGMSETQLVQAAQADFVAAEQSRVKVEQRKLRDYALYRCHREDVEGDESSHGRGPFGWSSITVPIAFWTTETILPRLATQPPKIICRPETPAAVPFARAKELRLQRQMKRAGMDMQLMLALKQMVMLADGPMKVGWDAVKHRPKVTSVYWWDFFCSAEAQTFETAEVLYHRTWYTLRQLRRMALQVDEERRPKYRNLDQVWTRAGYRGQTDSTYAAVREAAGLGPQQWSPQGGQVPLLECWYEDGSLIVLGGSGYDVLVEARESPFRDEDADLIRPFVFFRNSPDVVGPYAISDVEVVEDHQEEASTIRNQAMDQVTANLNAPVVYNDSSTSSAQVDAAFGSPGGKLAVTGDVNSAITRMPPGQVSQDLVQMVEMIRAEAQLATGINDYAAGQASASGVSNQTATGIDIIAREANKRFELKQKLVELAMAELGRQVDLRDRQFMVMPVHIPVPPGEEMPEGAGIEPLRTGGMVTIGSGVNAADARFEISVEAGSASPPSEREQAQNAMAWVQAMGSFPMLAQTVNWTAVARDVTSAFGLQPERVLLSEDRMLMQMIAEGAVDPTTGQTGEPVGEPVPVS